MFSETRQYAKKAGQPPGTAVYTGDNKNKPPVVTVLAYNTNTCEEKSAATFADCSLAKPDKGTTWVNVEGLQDTKLIQDIADRYQLHPLTVEDILNVEQRPKVEEFEGYLFVTLKVLLWQAKTSTFTIKQISLVLGTDFVITFQEVNTTLFNNLHDRIKSIANQRIRQQSGDYLMYRLIDIIVDQYFIVLEALGEQIETVEDKVVSSPTQQNARTIYRLKRQMLLLRKAIWPMREAVNHLLNAEDNIISKFTHVYLRDLYDHTMQAIDTIETFRDMLSGLLDMYLSSLTIRMNEIMKTLTIMTTIFIPIGAIAGIYGMNLIDVPLMQSKWGFPIVFTLMITITISMLTYFRIKKWF